MDIDSGWYSAAVLLHKVNLSIVKPTETLWIEIGETKESGGNCGGKGNKT